MASLPGNDQVHPFAVFLGGEVAAFDGEPEVRLMVES
jgi:hypothetical protein